MSGPEAGPPAPSVRRRLAGGALVFLGLLVLDRVVRLLSLMVLGRLLTPFDFGVVAYGAFAVELLATVQALAFDRALIRMAHAGQRQVDTVFTLNLIAGVAGAALLVAVAGPAAAALDLPALAPVLAALALVPLLDGLRSPRLLLLERDLAFALPATQNGLAQVAVAVTSVSLALLWGDYRAVVAGLIVGALVRAGFSHLAAPGRVRPGLGAWRECLAFSRWLIASNALLFLGNRVDRLFAGAFLGTSALGQFRMGANLAQMSTLMIGQPIERVAFPALARKAVEDRARLRAAYLRMQAAVVGLILPVGLGVALVAPELLRVAVGPQWVAAAPVLQVLAPVLALTLLAQGVRALVMADGRTRILFLRDLAMAALTLPALWAGVAGWGLAGLLAATAAVRLVGLCVNLAVIFRLLDTGPAEMVRGCARSLAAAAAMAAAVAALGTILPAVGAATAVGTAAWVLALEVGLGALVYLAVHGVLWLRAGRPDGIERFLLEILDRRRR